MQGPVDNPRVSADSCSSRNSESLLASAGTWCREVSKSTRFVSFTRRRVAEAQQSLETDDVLKLVIFITNVCRSTWAFRGRSVVRLLCHFTVPTVARYVASVDSFPPHHQRPRRQKTTLTSRRKIVSSSH
ncbi:hypothetical protein LIA77_00782 [Sarocladium implicatum]|nr:hypothetical protein LIA77_00782 [Sarocladium implicatum]